MTIEKVKNDGKHLRDQKKFITFLTNKGNRTPEYIWIGYSEDNIELYDTTKKGVISAIERDNRLSKRGYFTEGIKQ